MSIDEIVKKDPSELTNEEIDFLAANSEELSNEDKDKFGEVLDGVVGDDDEDIEDEDEEDEEIDDEGIKALILQQAEKAIDKKLGNKVVKSMEKKAQKIADGIVSDLVSGVKKKRAELINGGKVIKKSGDDIVKEWLLALRDRDTSKIKAIETEQLKDAKFKFLSTGTAADGGNLVPKELVNEVYRIMEDEGYGIARREMRYWPFAGPGNTREIPALDSSVTTYWINEGAKKKSSQPSFSLPKMVLKKLASIVPMTEELLQDSLINVTALIAELVAEAMTIEEDVQFFTGTGSPFTGILNNGNVQVYQMAAGKGFGDLTADDLSYLMRKVKPSMRKNGKFYLSSDLMGVIERLKDLDDQYIYRAPGDPSRPGTMWGKPVIEAEAFPDLSETGADKPFILFGDLRKTCILGDKGSMRVKLLDQATITDSDGETVLNLAEQDLEALRFVERVGYLLVLPPGVAVLKSGLAS